MSTEVETRICKVCGEELPIEKFQENRPKDKKPYRISTCNKCRYLQKIERLNKLTDTIEIILDRRYKPIKPERILDKDLISHIDLVAEDEIFVRLMDYKDVWISNYGRAIHLYADGEYRLMEKKYAEYGVVYFSVRKNIYKDGKWTYKSIQLYAAQAVVETFVVNHDKRNAHFIWHKGYNKEDNYYKHLYPLTKEQYRIVKAYFMKTGDDSEEYILKVMNDIKFKPDDWSRRCMKPVMCGVGYHGSEDVDCTSESYLRWHDMIHRCYNAKFHERQSQYKECSVCEEWLNYSNFKVWYDKNKYGEAQLDLDKDILFKNNKIYDPAHVVLVPHEINTLFIAGDKRRGDLPIGVHFDNSKNKYRAEVSFMGKSIKLGAFNNPEEAFKRYKVYKEDLIQDMAEQYKGQIPDKAYQAMLNWKVEITD